MRLIKDKFTKLKKQGKSRQQIYQRRQIEQGLCRKGDGRKIKKWGLCNKHVHRELELKRIRYSKTKKGAIVESNNISKTETL